MSQTSENLNADGFWHVQSTGDDFKDERLRYRLALEYLALEERGGCPGFLQLIVGDMPRKLGPIEIGFLTMVSIAARDGADEARRVEAYWKSCRAETE